MLDCWRPFFYEAAKGDAPELQPEAEVGRQSGWCHPAGTYRHGASAGRVYSGGWEETGRVLDPDPGGSASRYFPRFKYSARANEQERLRGCEDFLWVADSSEPHGWRRVDSREWLAAPKRSRLQGTVHPTLKPIPLVTWLARLILPPPGAAEDIRMATTGSVGRLLVPFSGVLSEAIGAALAGWPEIAAIEKEKSFVEQGAARFRAWGPYSAERAEAIDRAGSVEKAPDHRQVQMFDNTAQIP